MVAKVNRKKQILSIIDKSPKVSAEDIADEADITENNARRLLLFYYRQFLVSRAKIDGIYHYGLTPQGNTRLRYFER